MSIDDNVKEKNRRRKRRDEDYEDDEMEEAEERGLTERKGRATPSSRRKTTQPNAVVRTGNMLTRPFYAVAGYLGNVRSELEKVTWPTREETIRLTRIVLAVTIASAIVLGAISLVFSRLFSIGLQHPIILLAIIVGAVLVTVYYFRRGRTNTPTY